MMSYRIFIVTETGSLSSSHNFSSIDHSIEKLIFQCHRCKHLNNLAIFSLRTTFLEIKSDRLVVCRVCLLQMYYKLKTYHRRNYPSNPLYFPRLHPNQCHSCNRYRLLAKVSNGSSYSSSICYFCVREAIKLFDRIELRNTN